MCWSFQVAFSFAVIEICISIFIWKRSRCSQDHFVRAQWRFLPLFFTIIIVELCEAFIWYQHEYNGDTLIHITEASLDNLPSKTNQIATRIIELVVAPFQPFFVIWPCQMVGDQRNRDIMYGPMVMSLIYGFSMLFLLQGAPILAAANGEETLQLFPKPSFAVLGQSNYNSLYYPKTCAWIGKSGYHLHWTFNISDTWYAPGAFTYCLLWMSVVLARPWKFGAGILCVQFAIFIFQVIYFEGSFESGSVWCFSAMVLLTYLLLQPYVLPIRCNSSNVTSFCEKNKSLLKKNENKPST